MAGSLQRIVREHLAGCVGSDGGVAMQERAGEAVLLAVTVAVQVAGPDGETEPTAAAKAGR